MKKYVSVRFKFSSFLIDKKAVLVISLLLSLLVLSILVSLGIGQMKLSVLEVIKSIFGVSTDMQNLVVRSFRMPRILLAVIAGVALAISGALLQGIIRNPLASPDIIGITAGASFTTVGFLAIFSDRSNTLTVGIQWLPLASFAGAMFIGLLVYVLSWKQGEIKPIRLVLIGIGLSTAMQAFTTMMMILGPIYTAARANIWITGSVNASNWNEVLTVIPWITFFVILSLVLARSLDLHELGEEIATNAGSLVQRDRLILLLLSTALAGGAVAFAGGIGFVGLMAPHIARKLVGAAYGVLIPVSALIGGMIVLIADIFARTLITGIEIPVGVFTSAIGAPYFIYLLYKTRNQ